MSRFFSTSFLVGLIVFQIVVLAVGWAPPARATPLLEPPALQERVAVGTLAPMAQRLPAEPEIVDMAVQGKQPGRYGGDLRLLLGKQKDTRLVTVYGYARLVGYKPDFELAPDLLRAIDVKEQRIFTMHLRKGHRWSDGNPFTTEDFRYYWEDVANNEALSPFGPPKEMMVKGKAPTFEVIDAHTVRYSWEEANPGFLTWLAGARPPGLYRPAHYLKRYHKRYTMIDRLSRLVESEGRRNWADLHVSRDDGYRASNPDRPTLQPWRNTTTPPADRFVFVRNPYYHRRDKAGRQLPYIDRVIVTLGAADMVAARTGTGEADLQARYLRFNHYTFLKKAEKKGPFKVLLWKTAKPSHKALYPNLNVKDPVWRKLMRDVRFRRALSMGVNRREINQVIFYGLARESANTVLPNSPLYRNSYRAAWASFDLKAANKLLDEIGLSARMPDGVRKLPDGRPMNIVIDSAGESTEETDMIALVADSWRRLGIKVFPRSSQREVFRRRIFSGVTMMAVWPGLGTGLPSADMSPRDFVPSYKMQYQWPQWGQFFQSGGRKGSPPEDPAAKRLVALLEQWKATLDKQERLKIWHEILAINAAQVYTIGVVNGALIPVIVNKRLRNIPKTGIYHFDPGAYFGIYRPDTFWYAAALSDGEAAKSARHNK